MTAIPIAQGRRLSLIADSGQGFAVVHATGYGLFNQYFQAGESPRSAGRMPVPWSGSSRMGAARGPVGHGRPIWTDPGTALA